MLEACKNTRIMMISSIIILLVCSLGSSCPPPIPQESIFPVPEMLGEITNSSGQVFLQLGSAVTNQYCFRIGYDSSSHASDHAYSFETPVQTNKNNGDTLVFGITSGLSPDTQYYYSVAYAPSSTQPLTWRTERSFHTPRSHGSTFRFCVLSDFHYPGGFGNVKANIIKNLAADKPDFVVTVGDMVPTSSQGGADPVACDVAYAISGIDSQATADSLYEAFTTATITEFAHSSMLVWINGNHEGLAGYLSGCAQYQYVLNARRKCIPLLNHDSPNAFFGSLAWGDVQVIWIDPLAFSTYDPYVYTHNDPTGYKLGDLQSAFLSTALSGSTSKWKLIFAHTLFGGIPKDPCSEGHSYARGNANFVNTPGTDQIYIQSLMEANGVNAYCYGHDHVYSVSEYDGVKYIEVGTGATGTWTDCLSAEYAPWPIITSLGHLRVDVTPNYLQVSYVKGATDSTNGQILDTQFIYPH